MDYTELVRRLRECTAEQNGEKTLWHQAADAIEELSNALDAVNDAHNEGYDVGYWAGRRDYEPKWIPVTERLPGKEGEVLITDGEHVNKAIFCEHDGRCSFTFIDSGRTPKGYEDGATHWMPLPVPPKEETE